MTATSQSAAADVPGTAARRPRDPRLDFFRGLAMFIILIAHTPGNSWTLWIPARFGFSDAADIFVFCSGMASAMAFGAVFARRGWWLGTARVALRVWQVYWAHVGVFLVTAAMLFAFDHFGLGFRERPYIEGPYVVPLFSETGEALIGLLTLSWVPGLFDILPMYLVILGLVPVVMLLHRYGGLASAVAFVLGLWLAAQFAGYARTVEPGEAGGALGAAALALGERLQFLNPPSSPFGDHVWFFNPFAWQLIFFSGFALGMGWLRPPPVDRRLVLLAAGFVLLVVPFAWFKIHGGIYLPEQWALTGWIADTRARAEPLWWKTWVGALRYAHFIALVYLAWVAVGPEGRRLSQGFPTPGAARPAVLAAAGVVAVATVPYTYIEEIRALAPALDAWIVATLPMAPGPRVGLVQLVHLAAVVVLGWAALGAAGRRWLTRDAVVRAVPVVRKVGTQSLAVFMVSIVLARFNGWVLDWMEQDHVWGDRDVWTRAIVNLWGFAVLIATAYVVSWFKRQPWREAVPPAAPRSAAAGAGEVRAPRPAMAPRR
ncbi:MAG TPA: OpgC domain-containing protein [Thermohalobaculum sp.]|nr:OpgC domain-containing protein [Thermohalobaculum sp.]